MSVDREQVRRDARERLRRVAESQPGRELSRDYLALLGENDELRRAALLINDERGRLVGDLEQAERERDEALKGEQIYRDAEHAAARIGAKWQARAESAEAQLAAVPALVERGREYRKWRDIADAYPGHEEHDEREWAQILVNLDAAQEAFDAALDKWEQAQGETT